MGVDKIIDNRVRRIGVALFYMYVWGWYTGFIEMPLFSIQELLLSGQPFVVSSGDAPNFQQVTAYVDDNQETLQRYQLLASLFVDESDDRFDTEHFGFLTPEDARKAYISNYDVNLCTVVLFAYFGMSG